MIARDPKAGAPEDLDSAGGRLEWIHDCRWIRIANWALSARRLLRRPGSPGSLLSQTVSLHRRHPGRAGDAARSAAPASSTLCRRVLGWGEDSGGRNWRCFWCAGEWWMLSRARAK